MTNVVPIQQREHVPPHDLDAEAAVLSAILLDSEKLDVVADVIAGPGDFYAAANRHIYSTILELWTDGVAIDSTTVASRLHEAGRLDQVGGTPYIAQVIDASPAVANVADHARIIAERAQRRRIMSTMQRLVAEGYTADDLDAWLEDVRQLHDVTRHGTPLPRRSADQLFGRLPDVRWVIRDLDMCAGAPTLWAGAGFSGKTLIAQDLALSIAAGERCFGAYAVPQGKVLHLDYEQGFRLTAERYQRLAHARMVGPQKLGNRLTVVNFPSLSMADPNAEGVLKRECADHVLLIVDSLRAATPGIEENSSDFRRPLDMLARVSEATGCAVLVIHHARKPQHNAAGGMKAAIRGSGAIFDACGSVVVFDAVKGGPVRASHEKARNRGVLAKDLELTIADVPDGAKPRAGLSVTAQAAEDRTPPAEQAKAKAQQRAILEFVATNPGSSKRAIRGAMSFGSVRTDDLLELLVEQRDLELTGQPAKYYARGV